MTDSLIKYFIKYVKFDDKTDSYYIDNYKTVFEFLKKSEYTTKEHFEFINPLTEIKDYINITQKGCIDYYEYEALEDFYTCEFSETVNKVIDIFNYFNQNTIIYNDKYKNKFNGYILYLLDKKFKTDEKHETNRFIKFKKNRIYLNNYDMNYEISHSLQLRFEKQMYKYIDKKIDNTIKNELEDLLNDNEDILKNLVYHLNENSKNIIINEIIKYNEGEIMEKTAKNINHNPLINNMCNDMLKECNERIDKGFKERINEFIKSDFTKQTFEEEIKNYICYIPAEDMGRKIYDYAKRMDINKDLTKQVENITKKIKILELNYQVNNNNEIKENEIKEINNNENELLKQKRIQDIDKCFEKYGKQFNLKLGELMKLSKYENRNEFKECLKKKQIIKSDFKLAGSTYRLSTEQKTQFINDFIKVFN